jgi:signal peptidase I
MRPVLHTGDAIIVRSVPARTLAVGDIVTLPDRGAGARTVTHRLIAQTRDGTGMSVVTKGDASTGSERWSIGAEDHVARVVVRVPALGRLAGFLSLPLTRAAALIVFLVLIVITGGSEPLRR